MATVSPYHLPRTAMNVSRRHFLPPKITPNYGHSTPNIHGTSLQNKFDSNLARKAQLNRFLREAKALPSGTVQQIYSQLQFSLFSFFLFSKSRFIINYRWNFLYLLTLSFGLYMFVLRHLGTFFLFDFITMCILTAAIDVFFLRIPSVRTLQKIWLV